MIAAEFNRTGVQPMRHVPWQKDSIGIIARATRSEFASTAAGRLSHPAGYQREKVLDLLREVGPRLLEWKTQGKSNGAMARELNRLGFISPAGRLWGPTTIRNYLKRAIGDSTLPALYRTKS